MDITDHHDGFGLNDEIIVSDPKVCVDVMTAAVLDTAICK